MGVDTPFVTQKQDMFPAAVSMKAPQNIPHGETMGQYIF